MQLKVAESLTVAGYSTGVLGVAANWLAVNWLMALSALSIVLTTYWQWKRHKRQERKMKERGDE